jgi:hypothetical protein
MSASALIQLSTPDNMRGRIGSVNSLFIGASNELGEFRAGMTAGAFGAVPAVVARRRWHADRRQRVDAALPPLRRVDRFSKSLCNRRAPRGP